MAVSTTDTYSGPFTANGITVEFPFTFKAASAAELRVFILDADGIEQPVAPGRYSVSLGLVGGSVIFGTAPGGGDLYIESDPVFLQEIAFSSGQPYRPDTVNEANDRAAIRDLVLKSGLDRSLKVPLAADVAGKIPVVLPDKTWGFQDVPEPGIAENSVPFVAIDGQTDFNIGVVPALPVKVLRNGVELPVSAFTMLGSVVTLLNPCHDGDQVKIVIVERTLQPGVSPEHVMGIASRIPSFPAIQTLLDRASRCADVRDWDGMDMTGSNDCASLIQDAFNQSSKANVPLESPGGDILLGSTIDVPDGAVFQGPGSFYMASENEGRLMFQLPHGGRGFVVTGATGGATFKGFGTKRVQPNPGAGWAPLDHDWDFYVDGAGDISFEDILLLNPTRGIICTNGGGRFSFSDIWGQPLKTGIQIDTSYDRTLIDNVHFWNFWSEGLANERFVWDYTTREATAIYSKRNDNAIFSRLFSIFYRHLLRIGQWTGGQPGTTRKLRVYGMDADVGGAGLTIDGNANGATAQIFGFYALGNPDTITEASSVDIQGTNCDIGIYGKAAIFDAHRSGISVLGAGTALSLGDVQISGYNVDDGNYAGLNAAAAVYAVSVHGEVGISGGVNGAPQYSPAGRVAGVWLDYVPVISAGAGALTASTVNYSRFRIDGDRCRVVGQIAIVTNGSGSSDVRITLPVPCANGGSRVGVAKSSGAKAVTIQPFAGTATAAMNLYDGSYPGGNGVVLDYDLEYGI